MGKRKTMSSDELPHVWWIKKYCIQQEIFIDPINEAPLLHYASYNDRDSFISHLKMMGMNGSNHFRQTRFVFNTLPTHQRHWIHRMQGHQYYNSISVDGHLNIFMK
jgi:hypothetical protein